MPPDPQPPAADFSPTTVGGQLVQSLPTPTLLIGTTGELLAVSDSWRDLLAEARVPDQRLWLPGADLLRALTAAAVHLPAFGEVADHLTAALREEPAPLELSVPFPTGTRWFIVATSRLAAQDLLLVSLTDITGRRAAEAQLAHQASHDALTGLPNRTVLIERLHRIGSRRSTDGARTAVFFLDLDDFKAVNDTLGHAAGDQVLREVARRLRATVRTDDLVSRLGGDEFVVVAGRLAGELEALAYADRLLLALAPEVVVDGQPVPAKASIGIALSSRDDPDSEALLRHADIAMLKAKAEQSGHLVFDDVLDSVRRQRSDDVQALRTGIETSAIRPWFQPIVRLADGRTVAAEALARWVQPDGATVAPATFVPLAERTGLISPLDRSIMAAAAAALVSGPLTGLRSCSVNASSLQVTSGLIVDEVAELLRTSSLLPRRLTVELTETAVLSDPEAAGRHLHALKQLGVRIALDDFGTGYSSLSHLAELPIDVVKLDRSFVRRITEDERACEISRAVIALGAALDVHVVAEGVETAEQLATLRDLQCPMAQGFLYGPAVPAEQFAALHLAPALDDASRPA